MRGFLPTSDGLNLSTADASQEDNCPDVKGLAEDKGCPKDDRDGDGILDNVDQCPDIIGDMINQDSDRVLPETSTSRLKKKNAGGVISWRRT